MKRAREDREDVLPVHKKARTQVDISDIDDGCLLHIFKQLNPLPDLFHVAATCRRFKALSSDSRLSVLVTQHGVDEQQRGSGRRIVSSLEAAVNVSRAGDTIILAAGQVYDAQDVVISQPLKIVGSGTAADMSVLLCPKGPETALDFRSTAKVANLKITAMFSNCILHRQGRVTVDNCQLECYAGGLGHLFSPLITMAVSGLSRQQRLQATLRKQETGTGVLSVCETVIRGGAGASAVRCSGTGILQAVRVIHLSRDTFFWFEVHSGKEGHTVHEAGHATSTPSLSTHPRADTDQSLDVQVPIAATAIPDLAAKSAVETDAHQNDSLAHRAKAWSAARYANLVAH